MPGIRPTIGDVLEVRNVCLNSHHDQIGVNVLHYRVTAQGTFTPTLAEIAANLRPVFADIYTLCMANECRYSGVGVKNMAAPATEEHVASVGGIFGNEGLNEFPSQISRLVSIKTGFAGPGHRGRIYVPFPSTNSANSEGNMSASGITSIQLFAAGFPLTKTITSGANSVTIVLGVLRRIAGGVALPPGTIDLAIQLVPKFLFATQRRRGDYGRINPLPVGFV